MTAARWLRLGVVCGGLVLLYFVVPATRRLPTQEVVLRVTAAFVVIALLALIILRQLRLELDEGTDRRVDGLIVSVIAVVVVFSFFFFLLAARDPHQVAGLHTRIDALYFTMSTLTTIGYGDVHATGQAARTW